MGCASHDFVVAYFVVVNLEVPSLWLPLSLRCQVQLKENIKKDINFFFRKWNLNIIFLINIYIYAHTLFIESNI